MVTCSIHPPAGAIAYVAVQSGGLGSGVYVHLNPVMVGVIILMIVVVVFDKLGKREYPSHWQARWEVKNGYRL
ncbi:hypothetical protein KsCSTR_14560 [Candidatus Kuenenia stuttgartiensis]|jgi:CBS-domain-containing membrane protein|uniref:HPP transmembrane region domain-containing protein n=1 Tax=Kuenenia stuttgartiensis TaxID=174633 RepID=Q1Q1D1_KUEST|nr:HPP family protein [Planctomycetia bacterium]MBW7940888.1 HPP family protein [Candidatus Kuenenia stuttgartiensis]MBZ0191817.1 HPP family protein [Candidatus Kuenenia stuttgartiensis]MCF6152033.1 hypothetical protein [Candidatus Kuenenia stuttgartiensis]MCL4725943.1 HPP family protein [Candidatus Kuenenia stuttgartiensis]